MAGLSRIKSRNLWRVSYTVYIRGQKRKREKYAKSLAAGRALQGGLAELEAATRAGLASLETIEDWIERGWLKEEDAAGAFRFYAEARRHLVAAESSQTNYDALRLAYAAYTEDRAKPTASVVRSRNQSTYLSMADRSLRWLREEYPDLSKLTSEAVESFRRRLQTDGFAPWTIWHTLTALRILLDLAVSRNMIADNPARKVRLQTPKKREARRILTFEEIQWALERSLTFRNVMQGGLPTAVRMGLYLGLRPIEMCWFSWDWVDWRRRVVAVGETAFTNRRGQKEAWTPKDYEVRVLDAKAAFFDYLAEEKTRQEKAGLLNQFVIPAGNPRQPGSLGQALGQDVPQKGWRKMIADGGQDDAITIYSLRHTYCTSLLRPRAPEGTTPDPDVHGAGLDVRTVQERMGHADIRTTQEYLHGIDPDRHVTDGLLY